MCGDVVVIRVEDRRGLRDKRGRRYCRKSVSEAQDGLDLDVLVCCVVNGSILWKIWSIIFI